MWSEYFGSLKITIGMSKHFIFEQGREDSSLPRSRFLGCHATLPPKALRDSPKNGCEGD